jgi:deoxyribodipyrimidine photolyase-related protein
MKEATLIYPHQLFQNHPALEAGRLIYLIEEPLLLNEFPTHNQKLLLHRLSMQAYKAELEKEGYNVTYITLAENHSTADILASIADDGITTLHIVDTTDFLLEKRIKTASEKHGFVLSRYESPLFILSKGDAAERYTNSKKHLAHFYKQLRKDKNILIDLDGNPVGGQWSFDEDNRRKLPKNISLPDDISAFENTEVEDAQTWLVSVSGEKYGEAKVCFPYTRTGALSYLQEFLTDRFAQFGTYEDALTDSHVRVFHSTLSPLINIGLLGPQEVLDEAIDYAEKHDIALNNTEGFVRQILGWREFIRAAYETDGVEMRTKNFWNHARTLPQSYWDGTTSIPPIDTAIKNALEFGYSHHIERLMVLGNFMLLNQTHPDEVYKWFMAMYVDAYDWVMVPNVYAMSQFADGGIFATKPYISGSNYLKKMSNYAGGDWEEVWTALYWNFIDVHKEFFISNHRLSMMPRLLEKMNPEKKAAHLTLAKEWLQKN